MSLSRQVTGALRDLRWVEELGRANIALPDGLYVFPSEPALSSSRLIERRHNGSTRRGSIRAALGSFLQRWTSNRRPRR